jgi:hypothetical protein
MAGFYARFIDRFSQIAEPLHALKNNNAKFAWGDAQQAAFLQLKEALATPRSCKFPIFPSLHWFVTLAMWLFPLSFIRRGVSI